MMPPLAAEQSHACFPLLPATSVDVQYQQSPSKAIGVPPNCSMMGFNTFAEAMSKRCRAAFTHRWVGNHSALLHENERVA